jgi:putative SOS response-associated peptidase YedK
MNAIGGTKSAPVGGEHELFGFPTTVANAIVAPVHPKEMPVILTTRDEVDLWLEGETSVALKLQRRLPMKRSGSWQEAKKKTARPHEFP